MASAAEAVQELYPSVSTKFQITRLSSLLIDDEPENIVCALNQQIRAVRFYPDDPDR